MSIFRARRIGIQRPEVWFVLEKLGIFVLKLVSWSLRTTYLKCSSNRARVPCVEPANCRIITTMDGVVFFVQIMLFRFIRSLVFSDWLKVNRSLIGGASHRYTAFYTRWGDMCFSSTVNFQLVSFVPVKFTEKAGRVELSLVALLEFKRETNRRIKKSKKLFL